MSNFHKVGDKLVVLDRLYGHGFSIGEIVEIMQVDKSDDCTTYRAENKAGTEWWVGDEESELYESQASFAELAITSLQKKIYEGNVAAGWWENISTGECSPKGDVTLILSKLALIHSEVSEALEGVRKNLMDDHLKDRPMVEVELADAVIRILDLAGHEGYDVAGAITAKLAYNAQRADHKKENRLAEGGKKA